MAQLTSVRTSTRRWKIAYRTAIFESNGNVIGLRISEAEEAIVARTRELFAESGADAEEEREALDDALYALRALRSATEHTVYAA